MKACFTLLIFSMSVTFLKAQDESLGFKPHVNNSVVDSIQSLDFTATKKGTVVVHKDQRVENITEFVGRQKESIQGTKIDGYRIQIFFAESRTIAQSQKANFIRSYSYHKAYIDYLAPNYRVRVGNFRTRLQAEYLKQQLVSIYPTCIVLKDKIELPVITLDE